MSVRALSLFQGCSERQSSLLAAGWTLLGKGIGLRVSAKAVVTFASMFVVHEKATVQSTFFPPVRGGKLVLGKLLVLGLGLYSQHYLDFFVNTAVIKIYWCQSSKTASQIVLLLPILHFHFPQAGWL